MDDLAVKYKYSGYAISLVVILTVFISVYFMWGPDGASVNFTGGDAGDYYSSLVSVFINHDFTSQQANEWYLLKTSSGTVNVHPVGVAVLLLPFFLLAYATASLLNFPPDGFSLPFQVAVALAALFYVILGLNFIKKLFRLIDVRDAISALVILLTFFGTNLLHYTVSEAGMSHVYSFALISAFLFYSARFVHTESKPDLFLSAILFGLILLVRPNNVFVLLTIFLWFDHAEQCKSFFGRLLKQRSFYLATLTSLAVFFLQPLAWFLQTGSFFQNTYKRDGFYWFHPHLKEMLFGFDGGFFIYTPLCLIFIFGVFAVYQRSRFAFVSAILFFAILFYFFASYWAYTYFDGLGIRVLIDYYSVFALLGGLLFEMLFAKKIIFSPVLLLAFGASFMSLIYHYQVKRYILMRTSMTFDKWKYVFLKTSPDYREQLGGRHELTPYSNTTPFSLFEKEAYLPQPMDFSGKEYGEFVTIDSIGVESNRLLVDMNCNWREKAAGSSKDTQVCMSVDDPSTKTNRCLTQFVLNEKPAVTCCDKIETNSTAILVGDFRPGDRLSVYLWNKNKRDFFLEKLAVKVYNYSYQLN